MRVPGRLAALCAVFLAPGHAAAQTPEEQARLDWAQRRGRAIYEIDRAAWVTTDDLGRRIRNPGAAGVRGWTVERDGAGYNVTYYAGEGDARAAVYRARVDNNRVVSAQLFAASARPPLTPAQRRLADARGVVARLGRQPCTRAPFNTAVIPPETPDGPIDVYALTAQTDNDVYPFGGHYLASVSPAGEILSQRAFTRACLNMPARGDARRRPAALSVTHLLDPLPTEIHVFLAIWMGLPVYVGTGEPQRVWEVTADRIRLVESSPQAAPKT